MLEGALANCFLVLQLQRVWGGQGGAGGEGAGEDPAHAGETRAAARGESRGGREGAGSGGPGRGTEGVTAREERGRGCGASLAPRGPTHRPPS